MLSALLAGLAVLTTPAADPVCPIMGSKANFDGPKVEYNGAVYAFCCGGCDDNFAKNPAAALKNPKLAGKVTGVYLFDPVSGKRVRASESKFSADHNGTRFYFLNAANLETFKKDAKKYGAMPTKSSMHCPVTGEKVAAYGDAVAFVDDNNVRYYYCCKGCLGSFTPGKSKPHADALKGIEVPKAIPVVD